VIGSGDDGRWVGRGIRFTLGAAIVGGLVGLGLAAAGSWPVVAGPAARARSRPGVTMNAAPGPDPAQ
jgi:hypothetical protein